LAPPIMRFAVDVGEPVTVGEVAGQLRRYVPLLGGSVEGDFRGSIVPGGMDWQTLGAEGRLEISARYVLDLEQGKVEVRSEGLRTGPREVLDRLAAGEEVPASQYYFRTAMRFFTASPALDGLNHMLAVAVGARFPRHVTLDVHPVL
ncbi:MAG: DUF3237 family protein, partial [Novosphingobium sp.]